MLSFLSAYVVTIMNPASVTQLCLMFRSDLYVLLTQGAYYFVGLASKTIEVKLDKRGVVQNCNSNVRPYLLHILEIADKSHIAAKTIKT